MMKESRSLIGWVGIQCFQKDLEKEQHNFFGPSMEKPISTSSLNSPEALQKSLKDLVAGLASCIHTQRMNWTMTRINIFSKQIQTLGGVLASVWQGHTSTYQRMPNWMHFAF